MSPVSAPFSCSLTFVISEKPLNLAVDLFTKGPAFTHVPNRRTFIGDFPAMQNFRYARFNQLLAAAAIISDALGETQIDKASGTDRAYHRRCRPMPQPGIVRPNPRSRPNIRRAGAS